MPLTDSLDAASFPIGRLYEWLTRKSSDGTKLSGGRAVLVRCVRPDAHKHGDKDPSLKLDLEQNVFKCFGCHIGGGVLDLITVCEAAADRSEPTPHERAMGWLKAQTGHEHTGALERQPPSTRKRRPINPHANERVEAVFRYCDEHGEVLYSILKIVGINKAGARDKRFEAFQPAQPRTFEHERVKSEQPYPGPDGAPMFTLRTIVGRARGEMRWELSGPDVHPEHVLWHVRGVRIVPFHLPDIIAARDAGKAIFVLEGETDVQTLRELGLVATTSPFGSGFVVGEPWQRHFRGAGALINIADADVAGRKGAYKRHLALAPAARKSAILDPFPERIDGFDLTDYVRAARADGEDDGAIRITIESWARAALRADAMPESVLRVVEPSNEGSVDARVTSSPEVESVAVLPTHALAGEIELATPLDSNIAVVAGASEGIDLPIDPDDEIPCAELPPFEGLLQEAEPVTCEPAEPLAPVLTPPAREPRLVRRTTQKPPDVLIGASALAAGPAPATHALVLVPTAIVEHLYVALQPRSGRIVRVVPLVQWEERPSHAYRVSHPMTRDEAIALDSATYPWLEPDELARRLPKVALPC